MLREGIGGRLTGEREGIVIDGETHPDRFAGKDCLEIVVAMRLKPPFGKSTAKEEGEPGHFLGEEARPDPRLHVDGFIFEFRHLQVHPDIVLKAELCHGEILYLFALGDLAGFGEFRIGELADGFFFGSSHGDGLAAFKGRFDRSERFFDDGVARDENESLVGRLPESGEVVAAALHRDGVECGGDAREIFGRIGEDATRAEPVRDLIGELAGLAGAHLFGGVLIHAQEVRPGLGQLGCGEAVLDGAAEFLLDHGEGFFPVPGLTVGVDGAVEGKAEVIEITRSHARAADGRVFGLRDALEATIDHLTSEHQVEIVKTALAVVGRIDTGLEHFNRDGGLTCLDLVVVVGRETALGHFTHRRRGALFPCRHVGKMGRDQFLDRGDFDVTDDNDRHPVRGIPVLVELDESLAGRLADHFIRADGHAAAEALFGEGEFDLLDESPPTHRVAVSFFTEDDAALFVDLAGEQEHAVGVVAEELHAFVYHRGI